MNREARCYKDEERRCGAGEVGGRRNCAATVLHKKNRSKVYLKKFVLPRIEYKSFQISQEISISRE